MEPRKTKTKTKAFYTLISFLLIEMASLGKKGQAAEIFAGVSKVFSNLFSYVTDQLKDFPSLSLGEQIAYAVIGVGILLVFISIILFIL